MICRLRGLVKERTETRLILEVQGVGYQVFIPPSIMQKIADKAEQSAELELVIFHYQQIEPSRGIDVLIGFTNDIEREFFERFITVSGVGPKAAVRALTVAIPTLAKAIDEGDVAVLKSLPGIGDQRAKEIVAKLQGKVGKFALIQSQPGTIGAPSTPGSSPLEDEAIAILLQLEYKRPEAKVMVKAALARNPRIKTSEELLNEVYRQRQAPVAAAALTDPVEELA